MRKRTNFFNLLENQCDCMLKGMQQLMAYAKTHNEDYAESLILTEDEGDMARRILIDELNKTFITPIERKDIFDLSRLLDEILDYAKTTVDEIRLFNIVPNEDICIMVELLCEMCIHIKKAVSHMEKHKAIARDEAIMVKNMENKIGTFSYKALANLFDNEDFRTIFKYREIYRHLNHTADIADDAMDSLLDILVSM